MAGRTPSHAEESHPWVLSRQRAGASSWRARPRRTRAAPRSRLCTSRSSARWPPTSPVPRTICRRPARAARAARGKVQTLWTLARTARALQARSSGGDIRGGSSSGGGNDVAATSGGQLGRGCESGLGAGFKNPIVWACVLRQAPQRPQPGPLSGTRASPPGWATAKPATIRPSCCPSACTCAASASPLM